LVAPLEARDRQPNARVIRIGLSSIGRQRFFRVIATCHSGFDVFLSIAVIRPS
jgi:hypothetical protein